MMVKRVVDVPCADAEEVMQLHRELCDRLKLLSANVCREINDIGPSYALQILCESEDQIREVSAFIASRPRKLRTA